MIIVQGRRVQTVRFLLLDSGEKRTDWSEKSMVLVMPIHGVRSFGFKGEKAYELKCYREIQESKCTLLERLSLKKRTDWTEMNGFEFRSYAFYKWVKSVHFEVGMT